MAVLVISVVFLADEKENRALILFGILAAVAFAVALESGNSQTRALLVAGVVVLFWTLCVQTKYHPLPGERDIDAKIFLEGVDAIRQGENPYEGHSIAPPPTFVFLKALGSSAEFAKNLRMLNHCSALLCYALVILLIALGVLKGKRESLIILIPILFQLHLFFKYNEHVGNLSAPLAFIVLLLLVSHHPNIPVLEGLLAGLAACIKPYFVVLMIGNVFYLVVKRDKRTILFLLGCSIAAAVSVLTLGFGIYLDFLRQNSSVMAKGLINAANYSVPLGILSTFSLPLNVTNLTRLSGGLAVLAFLGGFYLCCKNRKRQMSESEVVYFLFLTTSVFPLTWAHYFSWLLGPVAFMNHKSFSTERLNFLIPAIFLGVYILVFDSISWLGSLALSTISFYMALQEEM